MRIFLAILAVAAIFFIVKSCTKPSQQPIPTFDFSSLTDDQGLTLGLFVKGCINSAGNRTTFAESANLRKADIIDQEGFKGLVKKLGYPTEDKPLNMWAIGGHYIMMYDFENHGCMITSNAFFPLETTQKFLQKIKAEQENLSRKKMSLTTIKMEGKGDMVLLNFERKPGKPAVHMLFDSYEESENPDIKTIIYFFMTDKGLGFENK